MRPKWDEKRGEKTYGEITITAAQNGSFVGADRPHDCDVEKDSGFFPLTDTGNAEWFAHLYGHILRYDRAKKRWLIWEGHRWTLDSDGQIYRLLKDAARKRFHAASGIEDLEQRRKTADFAVRSESRQKLDACLVLSRSEHSIADSGKRWDRDRYLLGLGNGVVDLRSGSLRSGNPDDRITMNVPVEYGHDARITAE